MRCANCVDAIAYDAPSFLVRVFNQGKPQESYRVCSLDCLEHWTRARKPRAEVSDG